MISLSPDGFGRYPVRQALLHDSTVNGQPPFLSVSTRHAGRSSRVSATWTPSDVAGANGCSRSRPSRRGVVFGPLRALTPFPEVRDLPAAPALYCRLLRERDCRHRTGEVEGALAGHISLRIGRGNGNTGALAPSPSVSAAAGNGGSGSGGRSSAATTFSSS